MGCMESCRSKDSRWGNERLCHQSETAAGSGCCCFLIKLPEWSEVSTCCCYCAINVIWMHLSLFHVWYLPYVEVCYLKAFIKHVSNHHALYYWKLSRVLTLMHHWCFFGTFISMPILLCLLNIIPFQKYSRSWLSYLVRTFWTKWKKPTIKVFLWRRIFNISQNFYEFQVSCGAVNIFTLSYYLGSLFC